MAEKKEDKKKKKEKNGGKLLKDISNDTSLLTKAVEAKEKRKKLLDSLFDL